MKDRPGVSLVVAGKRVAVDIATLEPRGARQQNAAQPRLRFDKVATRVVERLKANLGASVPEGMTAAVTITAPIRLASKTAAAVEEKIRTLLERAPGRDHQETIHGNRVRIRLLAHGSRRAPKVIGFVHNADSDPLLLLDTTRDLLERIGAEPARRAPRMSGR